MIRATVSAAVFVIMIVFAGCSTTHQARSVTPSGFLGDYSQLKEGDSGQALLRYQNPRAEFSRYNKIMIDPVKAFAGSDTNLNNVSREDLQPLVNYFYAKLLRELATDFPIVTRPGPDVMRLSTALTDADDSSVALDTISTILPFGLALSTLKRATLGTHTAVGNAQAEMDLRDSLTNVRLAAAVDRRSGTKSLGGKFNEWDDSRAAIDHWVQQIKDRLVEIRAAEKFSR